MSKVQSKAFYLLLTIFLSTHSIDIFSEDDLVFEKIWKYETDVNDKTNTVQAKPKEFENLLLFVDGEGHFFALDKHTGRLIYKVKLGAFAGRRGFTVDQDSGYIAIVASDAVRVGLNADATLFLIDARSGEILNKTSTDWGVVEPVFTAKCIITFGARDGIIKCHDRKLNEIIWQTELGTYARIWSNSLISEKHNMLYLVTSDAGDIVGKDRTEDLYSSGLIGINAKTGSIIFSRQMIKDGVWDFDGVGKPILIEGFQNDDGNTYDVIVGLNKTGTIFALNAIDGSNIKTNQFENFLFPNDSELRLISSNIQAIPNWPDRVIDVSLELDDLRMNEASFDILRHVKYGDFIPPSVDYDVITKGLHGGPQWFGGEYFRSSGEDFLAIPYNNNAWILRNNYVEDFWLGSKIYSVILRIKRLFTYIKNLFIEDTSSEVPDDIDTQAGHRWILTEWSDSNDRAKTMDFLYKHMNRKAYNKNYYDNCASCHRNDRAGRFESELEGNGYVPSLVGYTLTDKYKYGKDYSKFISVHAGNLDISEEDVKEIFQHFDKYDREQLSKDKYRVYGFWQSLLAKDSLPLNKGPWGGIAVINLNSGKKIHDITVGEMKDNSGHIFDSSIIFGGLGQINSKGESLLVGTVDPKAYYVSLVTGKVIQTLDLVRSGSVQPHLTTINGCEAWVIIETGGRYSFYERNKNGFTVETFINKSSCS